MYLFGLKLFKNKFIYLALKLIFGIGLVTALLVIKKAGLCYNLQVINFKKYQIYQLVKTIECLNIFLSINLQNFKFLSFKKQFSLKLSKSFRKLKGLPVRGQRTRTNAKTSKKFVQNKF